MGTAGCACPSPTLLAGSGPDSSGPTDLADLATEAEAARGDVDLAVDLAARWAPRLPRPGQGGTRVLWSALATLGSVDLTVARAVEPHLDAHAILAEAGSTDPAGTWGVWAAEGPGVRLEASLGPDGCTLSGTKPWCSLADTVSHALVTAWVDDQQRQLFAVDLDHPGVTTDATGPWVSRGLGAVRSTPVGLDAVPARPVGEPGWYLRRDGFAWGGIGVAAVWYGATVAIARRLWQQAAARTPDQVGLMHLGVVDAGLTAASATLLAAADEVDAGAARGDEGALLALRTRQVVADTAETVLRTADHALGPAPLTTEEEHAARVSDLRIYLRQHHAERDAATLGRLVSGVSPW